MSKSKKQAADRSTTISETDIKFVKIIQFTGWIFLLVLGGFMGIWVMFDYFPSYVQEEFSINLEFMDLVDLELDAVTYSFIITMGTLGVFCFALSTKINRNLDKKREIFLDWIIAILFFNIFAIVNV